MLPNPISWSYAFSSVDFSKDKTTYLAVICAAVVYLVLMMYARLKSSKIWFDVVTPPFLSNQQLVTNMLRK